jgi:hypothetical protein
VKSESAPVERRWYKGRREGVGCSCSRRYSGRGTIGEGLVTSIDKSWKGVTYYKRLGLGNRKQRDGQNNELTRAGRGMMPGSCSMILWNGVKTSGTSLGDLGDHHWRRSSVKPLPGEQENLQAIEVALVYKTTEMPRHGFLPLSTKLSRPIFPLCQLGRQST